MLIVAFDPGLTGAVAFIGPAGASVHDLPTLALPVSERASRAYVPRRIDGAELVRLIASQAIAGEEMLAFCERVQALPIGSTRTATIQSEGSLMRSLGAIEAACDILAMPATLVPPQEWQKFYGLVGKANELRARGELPAAVKRARELFPALAGELAHVKAHNKAESLLIGHYARRKLVT
ncbi:MAG: hypothetical protein ACTHK2_03910 [Dokdonella sp.]|uniref:hypothetical protein n=1 Tax=Dokdonella sp. TaxID=2291710 RepID=UPI003F81C4D7